MADQLDAERALAALAWRDPAGQRAFVRGFHRLATLSESLDLLAADYRVGSVHAETPMGGTSMCGVCGDAGDPANDRVDLYWHPALIEVIVGEDRR